MVILDIKDYNDEANRQLSNTNNYEQLDFNPTELHIEKIKSEINTLKNKNLLTSKTASSLSVKGHSSRILEFVCYNLQPEV